MLAVHRKVELDRRQVPAQDDVRHLGEPGVEERAQLGLRRVRRVMVELDVREHGDLRTQRADRAVGLVTLDHEPTAADAGVPAELRHDPADDPGRVTAGLLEHEGDHRRGRRLAVRTADHDRRLCRDELRQEVGPGHAVDPLQVRGRDDDLPPVRWARVAADVDLDPLERAHEDRVAQIPAAHLGPEGARDVRVRGHARAADADEVELAAG